MAALSLLAPFTVASPLEARQNADCIAAAKNVGFYQGTYVPACALLVSFRQIFFTFIKPDLFLRFRTVEVTQTSLLIFGPARAVWLLLPARVYACFFPLHI